MGLTSIGIQKTPARPVEITFAAQGGLPNPNQTVCLIGHMGPTGGSSASGTSIPYTVVAISNFADPTAGGTEAATKFGTGSELAKMVVAAIQANAAAGNSTFPPLVCVPLAQGDTDFGPLNAGSIPKSLAAAETIEAEFLVSPYDSENTTLTGALLAAAQLMSGATRVQNGQYGTVGVAFNRAQTDPTALHKYDSQFLMPICLRDTGGGGNAPAYSLGETAAACAALAAGNAVPFNPLDSSVIGALSAPAQQSDWFTVGAGLDSEAALNRGYTPLRVLPNGSVAFVRTVTSRLTVGDGVTAVTAYYDLQDFQILYFFRKAVAARFNQPDFSRTKASADNARIAKSEVIGLMSSFEDQKMFQAVAELAKLVQVQRNVSDRSRFDIFVPANVVPGLHVIASNVQATTVGDVFTV